MQKQSATRGDVFGGGKAEPKIPNPANLTISITTKFSLQEAEELKAKARAEGIPVRTYIRKTVLASELSRDTVRILAELRRLRLLTTGIWTAAADADVTAEAVARIASQVEAIEDRVLVARTPKGK